MDHALAWLGKKADRQTPNPPVFLASLRVIRVERSEAVLE